MSNLTARQKLLAVTGGGLVILVVIALLVIRPLTADLASLHQEAQQQKNQLQQLILEEASYKTARTELNRIEPRVKEIQALFPLREQLVTFVERLEQIAKQFENDFSISITDVEEQGSGGSGREGPEYSLVPDLVGVEVIPYDFRLGGSFLAIIKFLQTLENQPFFSEIEKFSFQSVSQASGQPGGEAIRSGRVEATVLAAFYARQKEKEEK